jgi:hypothetical protein
MKRLIAIASSVLLLIIGFSAPARADLVNYQESDSDTYTAYGVPDNFNLTSVA